MLGESERMGLIEIGNNVNPFQRSHLAEHQGEDLQLPTRAGIARMAEIYARIVGVIQRDIIQVMDVNRGTLNHCITRHLALKWRTTEPLRQGQQLTLSNRRPLPAMAAARPRDA
jgi:hypothetical protein